MITELKQTIIDGEIVEYFSEVKDTVQVTVTIDGESVVRELPRSKVISIRGQNEQPI